ncbi:Fe-S oxidoreductase [Rhodopirellula sp. P2]|uniref:Fe-S oxidoreductase n=1 Tax=Rhodopirellula sp. P2 TaxID=2127060 RepID=UPI002368E357|nr:Fe-S oxidoreductase [Rhodopirellula sp. P2]WDQ15908.1 Fe-S oxidoreductase [Rhodopirellula sp. P2]
MTRRGPMLFAKPSPQEVLASRGEASATSLVHRNRDANRPNSVFVELEPVERHPGRAAQMTSVLTLLLASSECSLHCSMCDLWRNTLDQPTPPGALPSQIRIGLREWREQTGRESGGTIKLYNSGNFFDPRTTPSTDDDTIAKLCEPFDRVVVENHPLIGTRRLYEFAKRLRGKLEIAVGLECIAPRMLDRLNKRLRPGQFFQFAQHLKDASIDLRVFLIHGLPWLAPEESYAWTILSARFAAAAGARHISVLPCRTGNGFMDRLAREGRFHPPSRKQMLAVMDRLETDSRFDFGPVLTLDTWGLEPDQSEPAEGQGPDSPSDSRNDV